MKQEAQAQSLTPRQREIVRLVTDGLTNRECAALLGISVRTAELYRFNAMRRLGVRNVAQLLRHVTIHGLISKR